jgi:hypothetical protein
LALGVPAKKRSPILYEGDPPFQRFPTFFFSL